MTKQAKVGLLAGALAVVVVIGAGLVYLYQSRMSLPEPGSARYEEAVSAFFAGIAALEADANTVARDSLTRATQLAPSEAAAWANLGLAEIRLGHFNTAEGYLAKARALAPENGAIERLTALLESNQGRFEESIAHLRLAIQHDPSDTRAHYTLSQVLMRQGDNDTEILRVLDDILAKNPRNLVVLLERLLMASKVGDNATVADTVKRLGSLESSWPSNVRDAYRQLEQAATSKNSRLVPMRFAALASLLARVPAYQRSRDLLRLPEGIVGEPITKFLRMAPSAPTPSPPDLALAYTITATGEAAEGPANLTVVVPDADDDASLLLSVNRREVRRADNGEVVASFPGGSSSSPPSIHGVAVADWNSDTAMDFVLAGAGGLKFLRREANGSFADVTAATKLTPEILTADVFGVWPCDLELDGDLDFVVGLRKGLTMVLVNHADGTFQASYPFAGSSNARAFAWADIDHDGDADAALIDETGKLQVFMNERAGRFVERAIPDEIAKVAAVTAADADDDGTIDLVLLKSGAIVRLSDRDDGQAWDHAELRPSSSKEYDNATIAGASPEAARLFAADLDNNGSIDFIASTGPMNVIWLGGGKNPRWATIDSPSLRIGGIADLNADGVLDLAGVSNEGKVVAALGQGAKSYGTLQVRPRAAKAEGGGDGRINSFGVGGEIQVRSGLLVQTQTINGPSVHFGLGTHKTADVARIVWPNGTMQAEFTPEPNVPLVALQRLKGSCPFLYAYNGKSMTFVTDFLWRSPLGLRINAQDTAGVSQTEDWVKIRGDQLVPKDGFYDVRVTAELWETHYWDHIALMTVDHPKETEIFVDERFARVSPALAVHAMSRPVPVTRATDDQGRDVTEIVRGQDGRYLDTFGRGFYQGVTRDHWVEIELGDEIPKTGKLRLVANGWIHPTDSSINVALGQGSHPAPQGLSLEVPNADGEWKTVCDDIGFPAGKNKTILIDLSEASTEGSPRKFRLRTNLEIFWDALGVAVAEDRPEIKTQRLAPESAELRLRGYSLMTQADRSSPEVPDYGTLDGTAQRWNDLIGFYTRFGDVRELLEWVDDRYIIANAGDELAMRFPVPPPPPSGWTRDFVLIGDGWNKDGDYNTAFSKTVLPLPSHDSPGYDSPPGALEDDPIFKKFPQDWQDYHTRYVTPRAFWRGLGSNVASDQVGLERRPGR